ncbi:MAG: SCP2 sterol-binding domain-containing protein [Proteobacteria bacterium]|nr:SCP2 sterol-binding domain-containing protein [Pseudomonadota bacterium]
MADQMIHLEFSMQEIFNLIPQIADNIIRQSETAARLSEGFKDNEIRMAFEFDEHAYSLIIRNGREFISGNGNLENPMVRVSMTMADLQNLIRVKHAGLFLHYEKNSGRFNENKPVSIFKTISGMKGKIVSELKLDDGSISRISYVFNQVETPMATITLTMDTLDSLFKGKDNPVNLFMAGQLQIDGDMTLAMQLQSIF